MAGETARQWRRRTSSSWNPPSRPSGRKRAKRTDELSRKRDAADSNEPRTRGEALTMAWRVLTDTFVNSILTQTTLKQRYMQYKGKAPKSFQSAVGGLTKPGKIGEVALRARQLLNWANKIAGFRETSERNKNESITKQEGSPCAQEDATAPGGTT